ncbi:MAG TPA: hypothetical protein VIM33_07525 [Gaiellaceae bacterium]
MSERFVQIAVLPADPENEQIYDTLYALDASGRVWEYMNRVREWWPLSDERNLEPEG